MKSFLRFAALALASIGIAGCNAPGGAPLAANSAAAGASAGRVGAEAAARSAPAQPQDRPGLGTGYGERRESRVRETAFARESQSRPWTQIKIFYNDSAGVSATRERTYWADSAKSRDGLVNVSLRGEGKRRLRMSAAGRFFSEPDYYVEGRPGERYSIAIENRSDVRMEFVVSVDGIDVIDGRPAALEKRGYLVEPNRTIVISGWRTGLDAVAAFKFTSVRDSYAQRTTGDARNVGLIGIAVFPERGADPRPYLEREQKRRERANPFPGDRPGGFAQPPPR